MIYLCHHPISAASEVEFLQTESLKWKETVEVAEKESASEKRLLEVAKIASKKYESWKEKYPNLWLIHT